MNPPPPSSALLQPVRFSTEQLPAHDRFDAWREYLRPVADLAPAADGVGTSAIDLACWDLGNFAMCQERNSGTRFSRTLRRVKTVFADHWYLFLIKAGSNWVVSDGGWSSGQEIPGAPGQLSLYSLGEAFHGEMNPIEVLMLFIPRDAFARQAGRLDRLNNTIIDTTRGRLLSDYMLALERQLPNLTHDEVPAIVRATEAMIAACLTPTPDSLEDARDGVILSLGERARKVVQARLSDPRLTPACLAKSIGVSRSAVSAVRTARRGGALRAQHAPRRRASRAVRSHRDPADPTDRRLVRVHQLAGIQPRLSSAIRLQPVGTAR